MKHYSDLVARYEDHLTDDTFNWLWPTRKRAYDFIKDAYDGEWTMIGPTSKEDDPEHWGDSLEVRFQPTGKRKTRILASVVIAAYEHAGHEGVRAVVNVARAMAGGAV